MSETDTTATALVDDGEVVRDGDVVLFSYGIPPRTVKARVVERKGKLIALTPGHCPKECDLGKLRKHVGGFYRIASKEDDPKEIEAGIFANRKSKPPLQH